MLINAKTDDGNVKFNTEKVLNFWPVGINKTAIEHETDEGLVLVCVNHDMQQICAAFARCGA